MKNKELFDGANADGDKALQAKLRNNFAEWIEVVRCQDCKHCDISLVLPAGRKMYTCMEGTHDHQMLLSPNDFCSRGKMRKDKGAVQEMTREEKRSSARNDERRSNLSAYCPNCGVLMDKEEEQ